MPETLIEKNLHLANLLLTHLRCAGGLSSATKTQLSGYLEGKRQCRYDESDDSSLDGCLSGLLLEDHTLVSQEQFVESVAGT